MSRVEKFETEVQAVSAEDEQYEREMKLWLLGGKLAQNFTILAILACACALLVRYY